MCIVSFGMQYTCSSICLLIGFSTSHSRAFSVCLIGFPTSHSRAFSVCLIVFPTSHSREFYVCLIGFPTSHSRAFYVCLIVFPTSHSRAFSVCLIICCSNSRSMILIFISISYCYKFTSWCLSHPTVKAWLVSLYGFFPICNIFSSCQYWVEIFISLSFIYLFFCPLLTILLLLSMWMFILSPYSPSHLYRHASDYFMLLFHPCFSSTEPQFLMF